MMKAGKIVVVVVLALLIVLGLLGMCSPDVNNELARTARIAVESARDAQEKNDSTYLWPGRLRMIVVVVGVTFPLAAAVIVLYLVLRHRPEELEVLAELHKYQRQLESKSSGKATGSFQRNPERLPRDAQER